MQVYDTLKNYLILGNLTDIFATLIGTSFFSVYSEGNPFMRDLLLNGNIYFVVIKFSLVILTVWLIDFSIDKVVGDGYRLFYRRLYGFIFFVFGSLFFFFGLEWIYLIIKHF